MDQKNGFENKKKGKVRSGFGLNDWEMFNICLFSKDMSRVLKIIEGWIDSKAKKKWIATVNPEFVMKSTNDSAFKAILKKTDLNVVDGIGLIWAKKIIGKNFGERMWSAFKVGKKILKGEFREELVTGVDLMSELCKLAAKKKYKVFFLGGFGDRAERTMEYFKSKFLISDDKLEWSSGEPEFKNDYVLEKINKFKPDILFVAYGMKRQEEWIDKNRNKADFGVTIGVGRSFDYYSGDLKRAPKVWRKMGMEWLYSLIKEPKRIKRQVVLPKFIWKVLTK